MPLCRIVGPLCLLLCLSGCKKPASPPSDASPRLITFSPALTKLTFDMGLGDHIAAVTNLCALPPGVTRPRVGDDLNIRAESILAVHADILLTQTNPKNFVPVQKLDPHLRIEPIPIETLSDLASAMEKIGLLTGKSEVGQKAKLGFETTLNQVRQKTKDLPPVPVLFVMGYQTPIAPGAGTFLDEMISIAGGTNILRDSFKGWKTPSLETILEKNPQIIFCQCPELQKEQALAYWQSLGESQSAKTRRVFILNDSDWTIPAGHLAEYTRRLADMIHPQP